jgi:two-component system sensor histidine kinase DesK
MTESACQPERGQPAPGRGEPQAAGEQMPAQSPPRPGLLLPTKSGAGWRASNLLWLVYSAFFITDLLQRGTWRDWLLFAVVYPCFVALYVLLLYLRTGRTRMGLLFAMGVLAIAYYPMNPGGGGGMLIYVAALAPYMTASLATAVGTVVAATILSAAEGALLHISPWGWVTMSSLAACVGAGDLIAALRAGANQRLLIAQEQIEHLAKVAERERIARDLHDVLGHTLSVVVLKSELAGKLIGADPERARREIGEVEQIARRALGEVREAIRGYRADGIAAEIARARRALDAAGVRLEWQGESLLLAPVHESVTNILRHAGATSCRLELASDSRGTRLTVHDNGRGGIDTEGNGLRGMRERVMALGGRVEIDSRQGTRLTVDLPAALGN